MPATDNESETTDTEHVVYCESVIQAVLKPGFFKESFWRGRRRPSGVGGQSSQLPVARGLGGGAPSNVRFMQFFNKNNAFLIIFWPKPVVLKQ